MGGIWASCHFRWTPALEPEPLLCGIWRLAHLKLTAQTERPDIPVPSTQHAFFAHRGGLSWGGGPSDASASDVNLNAAEFVKVATLALPLTRIRVAVQVPESTVSIVHGESEVK